MLKFPHNTAPLEIAARGLDAKLSAAKFITHLIGLAGCLPLVGRLKRSVVVRHFVLHKWRWLDLVMHPLPGMERAFCVDPIRDFFRGTVPNWTFHKKQIYTGVAVFGLWVLAVVACADQWVMPSPRRLTSPNQKLEAVMTPAADHQSGATATIGEPGRPGKPFKLAAKWMPVDALLFDDGSLLTFDNWHQLGYGNVATLHERDGAIRWTKTLVDLVGHAFLRQTVHSVSSIWWRKWPLESVVADDGTSVLVTLADENQLQLGLRDGAAKIVAVEKLPEDPQRLLNRANALARKHGEEEAVLALVDRVLAKEPEMFGAVSLYIEILQRQQEHARLVTGLEKMSAQWKTKNGHSIANVYVSWAASLTALSQPAEAERRLRLAALAESTYPNPVLALARLLVDQKRGKDADDVINEFTGRLRYSVGLDSYTYLWFGDFYREHKEPAKALAQYLEGYQKDQVTNQFLYQKLAKLYEEMGNDAGAIRVNEQLVAHFAKMGSVFDRDANQARSELARLQAKRNP